jgi:hypothetical protein
MKTEKLKFIQDGFVSGKLEFKKGEVYDVPVETGSVARWLKRGMAVVVGSQEEADLDKPMVEVKDETDFIGTSVVEKVKETAVEEKVEVAEEKVEVAPADVVEQEVQEQEEIAKKQPKTQNKNKGQLGKGL